MKKSILILIFLQLWLRQIPGQFAGQPDIHDTTSLIKIVRHLSSAWMEGREAGTKGECRASDYVAGRMRSAGLEPYEEIGQTEKGALNSGKSWFQPFKLIRLHLSQIKSLSTPESPDSYASIYEDGDYFIAGDTVIDTRKLKVDTLIARNVIGILKGIDTTRCIVIGAHYDHLGIHHGLLFEGADDNASGVAGMLALAKTWSGMEEKPSCNLIFAAWTAEEKGELGSKYFVQNFNFKNQKIRYCFNLDMIAGSAPEDTAHRQLSIGTVPADDQLRKMAMEINKSEGNKFDLDLWDVTGHSGSDYKYFSLAGIPVMTFFSGFASWYHTPEDIVSRIDIHKMTNILNLINQCIMNVLQVPDQK